MKTQRPFNILPAGLLLGLAGSLLLNLYQLNERNRQTAGILPAESKNTGQTAIAEGMAVHRRHNTHKDSLPLTSPPGSLMKPHARR
ncbi:hypothetical protein [Spirosoma montaniterrae]|uniref:Uncharacterized protein n=1 Tax=Spirosoma montaniterrae TaxID=1178516 RepID=A0A1P9X2R2_9BACT|nr:hypothetical protein [Spirosoma montaniterrae]AQG81901.1 hypothetical protein AWR27_22950 [Spirosoma montaniterrae]